MKRTILMLLPATFLAACAIAPDTQCTGQSSPPVKLHYGDSEVRVVPPLRNVHRRGDFVIDLKPNKRASDPVDYETVTVTVKGKAGAGWITEKTDTFQDAPNHRFYWCVPENQALGEYQYEVEVSGVGNLDPRVNVEN